MTGPVSLDLHVDSRPAAGGARRSSGRCGRRSAPGACDPASACRRPARLARDLGLARGTVAEAYAQLAAEGYCGRARGAPTRIATGLAPPAAPARTGHDPAAGGATAASARPRATTSASACPTPARSRARAGCARCGAHWPRRPTARSGGDPRGRPELRAALAGYLGRARGVIADPDASSSAPASRRRSALLRHALRAAGARAVAMEDPGLQHHRAVVARKGLRVARSPVDEHGARPRPVGAARGPCCSRPPTSSRSAARSRRTGGPRSSGGRARADGRRRGRLRRRVPLRPQPVGALQGSTRSTWSTRAPRASPSRPALRLGWLVLRPRLVDAVVEAKRVFGDTAVLDQLALAEFIGSGAYGPPRPPYAPALPAPPRRAPRGARRRSSARHRGGPARRARPRARRLARDEVWRARPSVAALGPYWHAPRPRGVMVGYAAAPGHASPALADRRRARRGLGGGATSDANRSASTLPPDSTTPARAPSSATRPAISAASALAPLGSTTTSCARTEPHRATISSSAHGRRCRRRAPRRRRRS